MATAEEIRPDHTAIYRKLSRIAANTDRAEMNPATHRDFLTIIDRAQAITRLEAEQAGQPID